MIALRRFWSQRRVIEFLKNLLREQRSVFGREQAEHRNLNHFVLCDEPRDEPRHDGDLRHPALIAQSIQTSFARQIKLDAEDGAFMFRHCDSGPFLANGVEANRAEVIKVNRRSWQF